MATSVIRSTYALDLDTVRTLDRLAERWRVSRSEALRRAVRDAAERAVPKGQGTLEALDEPQRSLKLTSAKADAWARAARTERRASAARHEGRDACSTNPADFRRFASAGLTLAGLG